MTRDEAVVQIQRLLGLRTDLTSEIIGALKDEQVELESRPILPWFLISEISSISTVSGEERVQVPTDFIREVDGDALYRYDSSGPTWTALVKDDVEYLRGYYAGATGAPKAYALEGKYFRLFPTPDDSYTLKLVYYKEDSKLDTNIENNWLKYAPALLIGGAGLRVAEYIRDKDAISIFQAMQADAFRRLDIEDTARDMANRNTLFIAGGA